MTTGSNYTQASAIAAALGATHVAKQHDTAHETYVLTLKENRRAHLSLQFGDKREPGRLFIEAMYPGDALRAGRIMRASDLGLLASLGIGEVIFVLHQITLPHPGGLRGVSGGEPK